MKRNKRVLKTEYMQIFQRVYELMDEPLIQGNCGEMCNFNCCRTICESGEMLGIYLLPFEFEYMQNGKVVKYEIHNKMHYEIPAGIKKLYFISCNKENGCNRDFRPIQCRTYPFEPHLVNDILSLVIEKDQIHTCPLIGHSELWRKEFIQGVYEGWMLLLEIPVIKHYIKHLSELRQESNNIRCIFTI